MTDERLGMAAGAWLRDIDRPPRDSRASVRQAMAEVRRTRQQGRWWPLPPFHLKARTATANATDTTEYRPRPIPATNGHAPTVIGRTQTMFSPVKAITAGALIFALGGLFLVAQPIDQGGSVPGAEQGAELAPPVGVTITVSEGIGPQDEVCTDATPPVCTWTWSEQWSATDDRLSGTATGRVIERTWGGTGWIFEAHAIEVVNDEGAWVGTGRYVGGDLDLFVATLTGEEAYEGLSAVVSRGTDGEGMTGVIVSGGLPPFPELIE